MRPCTAGASLRRQWCVSAPASLLRRRVLALAVEIRNNDLEDVPASRPLKARHTGWGGELGRRDSCDPFVLVHCPFGSLQQFVDAHGAPWIEVRDTHAQRQRSQITAVRRPPP